MKNKVYCTFHRKWLVKALASIAEIFSFPEDFLINLALTKTEGSQERRVLIYHTAILLGNDPYFAYALLNIPH